MGKRLLETHYFLVLRSPFLEKSLFIGVLSTFIGVLSTGPLFYRH